MTKLESIKISFIGGGNMAKALIGGLCSNLCSSAKHNNIHVVDVKENNLAQLKEQFGVSTSTQIDAQLSKTDVVILAVKPQHIHEVAGQLTPHLNKQLIISIAAGIRVLDLSRWLDNYTAIVRTMPNTPALINQGITGMYATPQVSAEQRAIADAILRAVGKTVWLENEALLDPLTAISGSGPAYVFYFIEALQKAAEEMGLNQSQSRELALTTFLGAAQLAAQSDEAVTALRERVTSKGGTTQAAIQCMEQSGVTNAIIAAAKAAAERGRELGNEYGRAR
jgi:pyrroline-5-carboxylate reductase